LCRSIRRVLASCGSHSLCCGFRVSLWFLDVVVVSLWFRGIVVVSGCRRGVNASLHPGGGVTYVSGEKWEAKTNHDKCRGSSFMTHLMGLPLPGSPLVFVPPQFPRRTSMNPPISLSKGRGGSGCALAGALVVEPTYLNRGEGLMARSFVGLGEWWWRRRRR